MSKKVIIAIIAIAVVLASVFIYNYYNNLSTKTLGFDDYVARLYNYNVTYTDYQQQQSFDKLCQVGSSGLVLYNSCDTTKVKNNLDNLNGLSLDDINATISISNYFSQINFLRFVNDTYNADDKTNKAMSYAALSMYFLVGSRGWAISPDKDYIDSCIHIKNFTDDQKKDCIINVLSAEKPATDSSYNSLNYTNINTCLEGAAKAGFKSNSETFCQTLVKYRNEIADEIQSDIDYNQKYQMMFNLQRANIFIDTTSWNNVLNSFKILDDNITNPYKALFLYNSTNNGTYLLANQALFTNECKYYCDNSDLIDYCTANYWNDDWNNNGIKNEIIPVGNYSWWTCESRVYCFLLQPCDKLGTGLDVVKNCKQTLCQKFLNDSNGDSKLATQELSNAVNVGDCYKLLLNSPESAGPWYNQTFGESCGTGI